MVSIIVLIVLGLLAVVAVDYLVVDRTQSIVASWAKAQGYEFLESNYHREKGPLSLDVAIGSKYVAEEVMHPMIDVVDAPGPKANTFRAD